MQTTLINTVAASGVTIVSLLAGAGGYNFTEKLSEPPPERLIQIVQLDYKDGKIGQDLIVSGAPEVPATWTAVIRRKNQVGSICQGSGRWNYPERKAGETKWFTPSEWTEDVCPELMAGDELSVTYEYTSRDNFIKVSGGHLRLTQSMIGTSNE